MAEQTTTTTARKKKTKRSVPAGQMHILATFNNTIITFTDSKGGALTSASAGGCGFRCDAEFLRAEQGGARQRGDDSAGQRDAVFGNRDDGDFHEVDALSESGYGFSGSGRC